MTNLASAAMILAAALAILFSVQFRHEYFARPDHNAIVRVDRFTSEACYIPLNNRFKAAADVVFVIPKCGK